MGFVVGPDRDHVQDHDRAPDRVVVATVVRVHGIIARRVGRNRVATARVRGALDHGPSRRRTRRR